MPSQHRGSHREVVHSTGKVANGPIGHDQISPPFSRPLVRYTEAELDVLFDELEAEVKAW